MTRSGAARYKAETLAEESPKDLGVDFSNHANEEFYDLTKKSSRSVTLNDIVLDTDLESTSVKDSLPSISNSIGLQEATGLDTSFLRVPPTSKAASSYHTAPVEVIYSETKVELESEEVQQPPRIFMVSEETKPGDHESAATLKVISQSDSGVSRGKKQSEKEAKPVEPVKNVSIIMKKKRKSKQAENYADSEILDPDLKRSIENNQNVNNEPCINESRTSPPKQIDEKSKIDPRLKFGKTWLDTTQRKPISNHFKYVEILWTSVGNLVSCKRRKTLSKHRKYVDKLRKPVGTFLSCKRQKQESQLNEISKDSKMISNFSENKKTKREHKKKPAKFNKSQTPDASKFQIDLHKVDEKHFDEQLKGEYQNEKPTDVEEYEKSEDYEPILPAARNTKAKGSSSLKQNASKLAQIKAANFLKKPASKKPKRSARKNDIDLTIIRDTLLQDPFKYNAKMCVFAGKLLQFTMSLFSCPYRSFEEHELRG